MSVLYVIRFVCLFVLVSFGLIILVFFSFEMVTYRENPEYVHLGKHPLRCSTCPRVFFLKGLFYVNVASCPKHHTSFQQRCVLCVLSHSHTTLAVSQHLAVFSKSSQIWSSDYQHLLIIKQSVASWSIHVAIYMTASMMITKSNV